MIDDLAGLTIVPSIEQVTNNLEAIRDDLQTIAAEQGDLEPERRQEVEEAGKRFRSTATGTAQDVVSGAAGGEEAGARVGSKIAWVAKPHSRRLRPRRLRLGPAAHTYVGCRRDGVRTGVKRPLWITSRRPPTIRARRKRVPSEERGQGLGHPPWVLEVQQVSRSGSSNDSTFGSQEISSSSRSGKVAAVFAPRTASVGCVTRLPSPA